jgi:hypothetical protein
MPTTIDTTQKTMLKRAAMRAALAPSVHNTQPWRLVLSASSLEIRADWARQLRVLDPSKRQLLISCGCALFNLRVVLAVDGYDAVVERLPDPAQPDLIARVSLPEARSTWLPIAALDPMIDRRQTNRRRFEESERVSAESLSAFVSAANAEDAQLFVIQEPEHRVVTASLSQQADVIQNADPAYRAEIRAWTTADPQRRDGVAAIAVPHVDAGAVDEVPIRDFDSHGMGWLPTRTESSSHQCLLLLGTRSDDPTSWVRAGEALERIWLEATARNYVASPLTQVVEIPATRERLRAELNLPMHPHILLRVGRAATTPTSRRRPLEDVLVERDQ